MNKKKFIIPTFIFLLLVICIYYIPKTFSILKSASQSSLNSPIAKWQVSLNQEGIDNELDLVSGVSSQSYTLKVSSLSEVDINYSIAVKNLPSGVEVALETENNYRTQNSNNEIIFENAGTILYGSNPNENTHILYFRSALGSEEVTNREIDIEVIATQASN